MESSYQGDLFVRPVPAGDFRDLARALLAASAVVTPERPSIDRAHERIKPPPSPVRKNSDNLVGSLSEETFAMEHFFESDFDVQKTYLIGRLSWGDCGENVLFCRVFWKITPPSDRRAVSLAAR